MKYYKLCLFILTISISGCDRQTDVSQEQIQLPQSKEAQPEMRIILEVHTHLIQLPEIIKGIFEELGITLKQQSQQPGLYIFTGQSSAGAVVTIEAVSITKGSSLLKVGVSGEDIIAQPLLKAIDKALEKALNERKL